MSMNNSQNYVIKNISQVSILSCDGSSYLFHAFEDFAFTIGEAGAACEFFTPYLPKGLLEDLDHQKYIDITITHECYDSKGPLLRIIHARAKEYCYDEKTHDTVFLPYFEFSPLEIKNIEWQRLGGQA